MTLTRTHALCLKEVGWCLSTLRLKCKIWVHKTCTGLNTYAENPTYECPHYQNEPNVCPFSKVRVAHHVLEVVDLFCFLGNVLSAGDDCDTAAITRCKCARGKSHEYLPLLTASFIPLKTLGRLYCSVACKSMLHAVET